MWLRDSPLERRARRSRVPARRDAVPDSAGALPGFQLDTPPPADQPRAKLAAPPPPDDAGPAHRYEAPGLCATFSPIARLPASFDSRYVRNRRAGAPSENASTAPLSPPSPEWRGGQGVRTQSAAFASAMTPIDEQCGPSRNARVPIEKQRPALGNARAPIDEQRSPSENASAPTGDARDPLRSARTPIRNVRPRKRTASKAKRARTTTTRDGPIVAFRARPSGDVQRTGTEPDAVPMAAEGGSYERGSAEAAGDGRAGSRFPAGPSDGSGE
jgi:hypothetical protein